MRKFKMQISTQTENQMQRNVKIVKNGLKISKPQLQTSVKQHFGTAKSRPWDQATLVLNSIEKLKPCFYFP